MLAGVGRVTPQIFAAMQKSTGLSAAYLRKKLRERGHAMDALVEGVRQDSAEHLERTLRALALAYEEDAAAARSQVLEARRHLDFAIRREPENPLRKATLLHLRTWLENPPIYPLWADLQKQKPPDNV